MHQERHPPGLVVLFLAEMWERFSFYSMLAMFTLYLQNDTDGFSWTAEEATRLYSTYVMFVYASPLIGGWLADWKLGYRRAVMIGGVFFMAGHLLLAFRDLRAVYAALTCLVIGNGFFKPNVSTMVGNLYPEGSPLKERAFNIFYLGINIGAMMAPIVAELVQRRFGFHPAFAVAAFGMLVSVSILWWFRGLIETRPAAALTLPPAAMPAGSTDITTAPGGNPAIQEDLRRIAEGKQVVAPTPERALTPDIPPPSPLFQPIDLVPDWQRIGALVVVFLVVIIFWIAFYQGGSTITYWADKNTDWTVSGIISNAINPAWIIVLTFPLIWFWRWLAEKGLEPSTPGKMVIGMFLAALAFLVLYAGALRGEATVTGDNPYDFKVSPLWIIGFYGVLTLAELMLSPMGLALVSKVAPARLRGLMMGGWFVATAIGGKLSVIGVYWDQWLHSTFFAVLAGMSLAMAVVLLLLLRPLKRAMPGV
jgi:POT family proton-dependent oligopeptide transporter